MKEISDLIHAFARARRSGDSCVLATVVRVEGSTYRRPGARALILPGGEIVGLIGGGCLENDLLLRAREVRAAGRPRVVVYDNTAADDILWGLGLGCNGKVEILLEPVDREHAGPLDFVARCRHQRRTGIMATVVRAGDPALLASRCMIDPDGTVMQSSDWDARFDLMTHANALAGRRKPGIVDMGTQAILIEPINPPLRLLVIGAGPDAVPLVAIAAGLGWLVEVFDHRESFARHDRFPGAVSVSVVPIAEVARTAQADRLTAVVLMTHHFLNDRELLRGFVESNAGYLGVLGPKARLEQLLDSLQHDGFVASAEQLRRVRGPVGLDLGAETPEEIALSIAAEIQSCFAGYDGRPLTIKSGPIHD
jgi:xanthine dehydrogenase accessory factor